MRLEYGQACGLAQHHHRECGTGPVGNDQKGRPPIAAANRHNVWAYPLPPVPIQVVLALQRWPVDVYFADLTQSGVQDKDQPGQLSRDHPGTRPPGAIDLVPEPVCESEPHRAGGAPGPCRTDRVCRAIRQRGSRPPTADNETARQRRYATIRSGGALPGAKPPSRAIEVRAVATPMELALFGSGTCASYCAYAQSNGSTTTKVSGSSPLTAAQKMHPPTIPISRGTTSLP